jgi:hypothetical protein
VDKLCTKCGVGKDTSCFSPNKQVTSGLASWCKDCYKKYRTEHSEDRSLKEAKRRKSNPEREKIRHAEYRKKHREEISKQGKDYYERTKEARKEKRTASALRWYHNNKERCFENNNINRSRKYKEDPRFKLSLLLRNRVNSAIKRGSKAGSGVRDLGCSVEELKSHLESKFQSGMTWENWGTGKRKWNIDHIMPLAAFNLANRQHVLLACHYMNLRPMWSSDNLSKNDAYPTDYLREIGAIK